MLEYFHNLASLVVEIDIGEGMHRYSELQLTEISKLDNYYHEPDDNHYYNPLSIFIAVSRNYISWYFKSILHETGVSKYNMLLGDKTIRTFQHQLQRILCSNATQELDYVTPHQTKVSLQNIE